MTKEQSAIGYFQGVEDAEPIKKFPVERLLLDPENPRLPNFDHEPSQNELLEFIVKTYAVTTLVDSFVQNGYFDEEPLVGIPSADDPDKVVIVEGNRRLAALILLLNPEKAAALKVPLPNTTAAHLDRIRTVPVRMHLTRAEVLPYLGYRHITGVMPWDSYSKAKYVAQLVEQGNQLPDVQRTIGDRFETAPRLYRAYLVWEQAKALKLLKPIENTAPSFSYLFTALTFRPVLSFLGLAPQGAPRKVTKSKEQSLGALATYLYGNEDSGQKKAIEESRQIKDLAQALASAAGRKKLEEGATVEEALEAIPAQDAQLERLITRSRDNLVRALEFAPKHRGNADLADAARQLMELATRLVKQLERR